MHFDEFGKKQQTEIFVQGFCAFSETPLNQMTMYKANARKHSLGYWRYSCHSIFNVKPYYMENWSHASKFALYRTNELWVVAQVTCSRARREAEQLQSFIQMMSVIKCFHLALF